MDFFIGKAVGFVQFSFIIPPPQPPKHKFYQYCRFGDSEVQGVFRAQRNVHAQR